MQGSFSGISLHVLLGALVTEPGISILLMGKYFLIATPKISRWEAHRCFILIAFCLFVCLLVFTPEWSKANAGGTLLL